MILTHPHFIGALSLLLFAILLAAGGIGFASATQAAGLAVAFLVAATPSRENLPQTGAWWQAAKKSSVQQKINQLSSHQV